MLRRLLFASYERRLNRAYRDRLISKGSTAQGVFWRSQSSQYARFDALLSLVHQLRGYKRTSIADIGCGYGAMLDFINLNHQTFGTLNTGSGYKPRHAMIAACRQKIPYQPDIFSIGNRPPDIVDFCLFSGTFNLTHIDNPALWNDYIFACLDRCIAKNTIWADSKSAMRPHGPNSKANFLCLPCRVCQACRGPFWPYPRTINTARCR